MAIETPNLLYAMASLNLANVADSALIVKGFGFSAAARASAGVYTLTLLEPLDLGGGAVFITHAAGTSRIVVAQLLSIASAGLDNVQVNGFTDAGVAADTGEAYLSVFRYPII